MCAARQEGCRSTDKPAEFDHAHLLTWPTDIRFCSHPPPFPPLYLQPDKKSAEAQVNLENAMVHTLQLTDLVFALIFQQTSRFCYPPISPTTPCTQPDKKSAEAQVNLENAMMRYEFLEALVRSAISK